MQNPTEGQTCSGGVKGERRLKETDSARHQQTCCLNTLIFKILNQHCLTYGPTKYQRRHLVGHQAAQIASTRTGEAVKMYKTLQQPVSII